jgi:hypothetical protein
LNWFATVRNIVSSLSGTESRGCGEEAKAAAATTSAAAIATGAAKNTASVLIFIISPARGKRPSDEPTTVRWSALPAYAGGPDQADVRRRRLRSG